MINVMYHKEGMAERCECHIQGLVYELAMEYAVLSKKIAEKFPEVLEISQILVGEISTEEDD